MKDNLLWVDLKHFITSPKAKSIKQKIRRILGYPGMRIVLMNRLINQYSEHYAGKFFMPLFRMWYKHMQRIYGIQLPLGLTFGENLRIYHYGGIVIHPNSYIGNNVSILQGVTLGCNLKTSDAPVIDDGCLIAAGAKVIGGVRIGKNSVIGPNVVITFDVPANTTVTIDRKAYKFTQRNSVGNN